jgi:serine/threonine protein kinase
MAIPDEYTFEEVIHKVDNLVVYRANHPIHGKVLIYMPDDTLSPETAVTVKRRLYQNGIQMRSFSELQLPFVTRALEVSQNPSEPYIIAEYTKYNLEELISGGARIKPKRIFKILSQVLEAIIGLAAEGCKIRHLRAHHIRLRDIYEGNATLTALEATGSETNITKAITTSFEAKQTDTVISEKRKESNTVQGEETRTLSNIVMDESQQRAAIPTLQPGREPEFIQRNIYILGDIAYQLLFANEYHLSDNTAAVNIEKLGSRWRKVVNKALSPSLDQRYETYEAMLSDINRALSRNKKITIGAAPVFVLLAVVGALLGYNQYHRHKIMTSEAGQAIEKFLNVVNKTNSEFPPPLEPSSGPVEPNDDAILKPLEEIPTLAEED